MTAHYPTAPIRKRLTNRQLDASPFPTKAERKRFLDGAILDSYIKNNNSMKNGVSGKSYTVAILLMDELERQMIRLKAANEIRYNELMSDACDSLPMLITVPTLVYWMNPYLKDLAPDDPKIKSKCSSFYTSNKAKYLGFFDRLHNINLITRREQIGANGTDTKGGRGGIKIWISKDIFMGLRMKVVPQNIADTANMPTENDAQQALHDSPLFLGKTGLTEPCSYLINSNTIVFDKIKIQSENGEMKSSECENVQNGADDFTSSIIASKLAEKKEIRTDVWRVQEKAPPIAPAPPPNANAESLRNDQNLADYAQEIADSVEKLYRKWLPQNRIKGSQNRFVVQLERHEWRKMHPLSINLLKALHREGEWLFETKERIKHTLEREDIRLTNNEKATLYVPIMYLNSDKTPTGEWKMATMSVVAFHDRLHPIDAPPQYQTQKTTVVFDNENLKRALGNSMRSLQDIGIHQALVLRYIATKGEKNVIRTVNEVLKRHEKINGSARAYMVKSLSQCGWSVAKIKDIVKKKDKSQGTPIHTLYCLAPEVQTEIIQAVAWMANKQDLNSRMEVYTLLCGALSNLKPR